MKRVIFIGQAMPRFKKDLHDWPSLNAWLHSVGITDKDIKKYFFYSALVDYFPGTKNGTHRVPTEEEINKEKKKLSKTIGDFGPQVVVTIGKLSLSHCLRKEIGPLNKYIGKTFYADPYGLCGKDILIIPFPHPSGASTWYKNPHNGKLLIKTLTLLKRNIV